MGRMALNPRSRIAGAAMLTASALLTAGCGGGEQPVKVGEAGLVSEAEARRIYTMKCSLCHGSDGKLMASQAPDLSTSVMTLAERKAIIQYGKGVMPPQNGILSGAEIEAVAQYIETFRSAAD